MVVRAAGELQAAHDAQARTVLPAEGRDGRRERYGVGHDRLELELVVIGQAKDIRFRVGVDRLAGRDVDRWQRLLVDPELERAIDRSKAAAALLGERRAQVAFDEQTAIRSAQADRAVDGSREAQAFAGVDLDAFDLVRADRAGRLGQEARDVERQRRAQVQDLRPWRALTPLPRPRPRGRPRGPIHPRPPPVRGERRAARRASRRPS